MTTTIEQQWLDYFATGQINWFPYNMQYLQQTERLHNIGTELGSGGAVEGAAVMGFNAIANIPEYSYFGIVPNPALGVSAEGLLLPTVPLIRWDDMVAVLINNMVGPWARAQNRGIIPQPPVGNPGIKLFAEITVINRNGDALKASIPNPHNVLATMVHPTPAGQRFGETQMFLDPGLGPEQVMDFAFLLYLMCQQHGIKIYHFGGYMGVMKLGVMALKIVKMN